MLRRLHAELLAETLFGAILGACTDQSLQDEGQSVMWSRHFLACIAKITNAKGIIGCRSVTFHPHFQWFQSLSASDGILGSVDCWPADPCVLLLDAYPNGEREGIIRRAVGHQKHVWVLRMVDRDAGSSEDHTYLLRYGAQLYT